jgi:hypothetical protein
MLQEREMLNKELKHYFKLKKKWKKVDMGIEITGGIFRAGS